MRLPAWRPGTAFRARLALVTCSAGVGGNGMARKEGPEPLGFRIVLAAMKLVAGVIVGALLWVFFVAALGRHDPLACTRVAGASLLLFAVGGGLLALIFWGRRSPGEH